MATTPLTRARAAVYAVSFAAITIVGTYYGAGLKTDMDHQSVSLSNSVKLGHDHALTILSRLDQAKD
jgi:hypothetical protein